ncbi:cbb3-type cytochrome c oxidase subunit 3 [Porticoccus sp. W117]|uniref:cbb3-type cytochrome oxidase subunit 3 n=1 Tax=Porticoccus sp. W117 TaxID=3054777 RepID=UPI002592A50B|nr:cbb3-type cytochrome c oxidase subunit 3 [Porticoccus sp. W117]MDM3871636.1 cbb3-type cytochrome c oxidase subunit 3 [Porticoccus sp. W117]
MDQGTLQGIGTILAMLAFGGVIWWALSPHKKKDFEEAAQLPFEEGELDGDSQSDEKRQDL